MRFWYLWIRNLLKPSTTHSLNHRSNSETNERVNLKLRILVPLYIKKGLNQSQSGSWCLPRKKEWRLVHISFLVRKWILKKGLEKVQSDSCFWHRIHPFTMFYFLFYFYYVVDVNPSPQKELKWSLIIRFILVRRSLWKVKKSLLGSRSH